MRRPLERGDRVGDERPTLHQPGAEARQGRLADPHGAQRQVRPGHVIHPRLDGRGREVRDPRQPTVPIAHEDQELLEYPSVGLHASFCFPTLLALKVAEVLDQLRELLGHGLSPPARATTTFSLVSSIGRHDPCVKRTHGARRQRRREPRINGQGRRRRGTDRRRGRREAAAARQRLGDANAGTVCPVRACRAVPIARVAACSVGRT